MFSDKDEELRRLEEALLEQEADEALLQEDLEYDAAEADDWTPDYPYRAYNADHSDVDLDKYSEEVWRGKRRVSRLAALACILATGILLVLLYIFLRFGGYL